MNPTPPPPRRHEPTPQAWLGFDTRAWLRLLARNRFAVHRSRWPVALIISAVMVVSMLLLWLVAMVTDRPLNDLFQALALYHRHQVPFQVGVVHLRDVVYYLSVIALFLYLNVKNIEARKWR